MIDIKIHKLVPIDLLHKPKKGLISLDDGYVFAPYIPITVNERSLIATWGADMARDVSEFRSIDAEAELTRILNEEVRRQQAESLRRYIESYIGEPATTNNIDNIRHELERYSAVTIQPSSNFAIIDIDLRL